LAAKDPSLKNDRASRRDFLAAGCGLAAMLALGGWSRRAGGAAFLRPPGALEEASFLARCIRCDRCRGACPTAAVGVLHTEDGVFAARTPTLDFHIGYCDFCGDCAAVCPTGALQPFDAKTARIGLAEVNDRCIALNSGGCNVCGERCPYGAVSFDGMRRPVVDAARCNGCGVCENACPALVLRSYLGGKERGIVVKAPGEATSHAAGEGA
jgi:ferredoxin-type protein NapG